MVPATTDREGRRTDGYVEAYEDAQMRNGQADLRDYLPASDNALYPEVLAELIRVDLEYGWQRGQPLSLAEYQRRFPEFFRDPKWIQILAFEEYRLRRQAGEDLSPDEYQQKFGVETAGWQDLGLSRPPTAGADIQNGTHKTQVQPVEDCQANAAQAYRDFCQAHRQQETVDVDAWCASYAGDGAQARLFRDVHQVDPQSADRLAQAIVSYPDAGTKFLGFQLLAILGQGAFGRVYLAQQGNLAGRKVALKVAVDIWSESQTLAQLQHTNIVPIYSVHRAEPFQAVCMPYFGSTTLAFVLRDLQGRPTLPETGRALLTSVARRSASAGVVSDSARSSTLAVSAATAKDSSSEATPPAAVSDATWKTLEGLTYVEAVLWMGARLADGLAHAHERGILHRDLKPANILLTDEGQPMLLDFNLSEDTKLRASAAAANIGGTLPYMAPEHLEAFRSKSGRPDARSDIYSLGVILFELLTGKHPFEIPNAPLPLLLPRMIAERQKTPPRLRHLNPAISPAVESIIRHCLEPDPGRRYQTARALITDLERQLHHLPLQVAPEPSWRERAHKWMRRHPRLASTAIVGGLALVLVAALSSLLLVRGQQLDRSEALHVRNHFRDDLKALQASVNSSNADQEQLEQVIRQCQQALQPYQVTTNPAWANQAMVRHLPAVEQPQLREDVGEMLLLLAQAHWLQAVQNQRSDRLEAALQYNQLAERCYAAEHTPRVLWEQRAELVRSLKQEDEARRLAEQAKATPLRTARDHYLLGREQFFRGRSREALALLDKATRLDPQYFLAWFLLGRCHDESGQEVEAAACYSTCIALRPDYPGSYFNRGLAYLKQRNFAQAAADFDQVVRLQPGQADGYINRALARQGMSQPAEAIEDLTRALELGAPTRIYFLRARCWDQLKDKDQAERDRSEGLRREPSDEKSWIARGMAKLPTDPQAALADFDKALELNPRSRTAMQNKAHVLAEKLGRGDEAVAVLDGLLQLYPDYVPALGGRGVLLARQGKREAALVDADACLRRDSRPPTQYQVACIYALTSKDHPDDAKQAFRLLSAALRKGYGANLLEKDSDLDPLRQQMEFRQLVQAVRTLEKSK